MAAPIAKHRPQPKLPDESPSLALRPNDPQSPSQQVAARKPDLQGDVFLREVDDALREDQFIGAFRRYGTIIGVAVAALLLGLAGWLWWDHHSKTQAGEAGEQLTLAIDNLRDGKDKDAAAALDTLAARGDAFGPTAQLLKGGMALKAGKADDAAKQFAAVAADTGAPQPLRDLATIREIATNYEKLPPQQVIDRLKPLAVPGNPWFGSAGEMTGMAYIKQGRGDLAGPLFGSLAKDKTVPETIRRRSQQLAGLLGVDAVEDPGKAAVELAPPAQ